jgi:hypothetical protein
MYVVAITQLSETRADLPQLAGELGTTAYELKLVLAAGLPAIVRLTVDAAAAADAVRIIERQGHRAVSADRRDVTACSAMRPIVEPQLEPDAFRAGAGPAGRIPYGEIVALLRATHRTRETVKRQEKERTFRPGMAIATGGLIYSKTTTHEVVTHTDGRDEVLYLFTASGTPWLLRERTARYAGLGAELAPSSLENFKTVVRRLRERAPHALYDERLQGLRSIRGITDGVAVSDLIAHLIVLDLRKGSPAPVE